MKEKEFQELPIGTVLIWECDWVIIFEVKISKNCTIGINDTEGDFFVGQNQNYVDDDCDLECLSIAPKEIITLFNLEV